MHVSIRPICEICVGQQALCTVRIIRNARTDGIPSFECTAWWWCI